MPDPRTDRDGGQAPDGSGSRLAAAFRRPTGRQLVVAVLLAALGFGTVTQVRSNEVNDTYDGYREQALIDVLNGLAGTTQRAEAELARLEEARTKLQSDNSAEQAALAEARNEIDTLALLAGTVPVSGPGIRITITEVTGSVDIDSMLDTLQEMRAAFAEAMQINGQVRIVASTSFEAAVGGIYVDGILLEPPYVIDVIGDPATLSGAMVFPEGPIAQLRNDGAEVVVDELQSLDIEAVAEPERLEFAQPDTAP